MFIEWFSFSLVSVAALAVAAGLASSPHLRVVRNLLIAGALMRIVGVFARHAMIFDLYNGGSDAVGYFNAGRIIADHFLALDFSILGSAQGGAHLWGTQAVRYASGLVITLVGSSVRGTFLVFSMAAFVGLACMAIAFGRTNRSGSIRRCVLLLLFWPTLWFWPSSIGKEAMLLLAIGLVTLGYVGRAERIHWIQMVSGLTLALAIRPHVAGVLAVSVCVAEWAARGWTARRAVQAVLASAMAIWLLIVAFDFLGLASADADVLQDFVLDTAAHTNQGGSAFEQTGNLVTALPMAFVNILCRPFVTEAQNPMALVSSLEMVAFWVLVFANGRQLWLVLRSWRFNRLLRFAIPFSLLYILMIGLTFQNLGIIARQRALVMPALLLMLAAAVPAARTQRSKVTPYRRVWRDPAPTLSIASIDP
jgi:hypothetical protein